MKVAPRSMLALVAMSLILAVGSGCAKKAKEAPPTPPPTPPVTAPPETTSTPAPPPAPAPTPAPQISASDFQDALFDFDAYALRDDARAALDKDAKLLRDNAGTNVTIEGHCDERGTAEYNQALGEKRAQAARDYLVAAGIDAGRIQTISYGKERPFADGHDESAWAQNRRAHFVLK